MPPAEAHLPYVFEPLTTDRCRVNPRVTNQPRTLHRSSRILAALLALTCLEACAAEPESTAADPGAAATAAAATETMPVTASDLAASSPSRKHYVRMDGGDAEQCTGSADAPYPGSGSGQACAWNHPFHALSPDGRVRIDGGDTLLIASGSYMIGPGAPGALRCAGSECSLPPVPSGPSPASPTRILGESCPSPPKLWGAGGIRSVLNLDGSSNLEVGCLEITDQDDCVHKHSEPIARCGDNGNWARVGVYARRSANVRLHDLDIHGLAHTGINAGGLKNWTVEHVKLIANGRSGWDGNVGDDASSNSGGIILRDVEIGWNGCGERWQARTPWACWAQKTGGYGDGLGTRTTGGQWLIEDVHVHHNTSDGLDLRYLDGADATTAVIRRLHAVGNAGNQVKVRGNAVIENSVIVGHCSFFSGKHYMVEGDHCRAGGNALQLVITPGDAVTIRHNTIAGEGGALIGAAEGDRSARVNIRNNLLVGHPALRKRGVLSAVYYANKAPAQVDWAGNLVWNVKNKTCPPGSICGRNPQLSNLTLSDFDPRPRAGSPVMGKASSENPSSPPRGQDRDFQGAARPHERAAIGAIEAPAR